MEEGACSDQVVSTAPNSITTLPLACGKSPLVHQTPRGTVPSQAPKSGVFLARVANVFPILAVARKVS